MSGWIFQKIPFNLQTSLDENEICLDDQRRVFFSEDDEGDEGLFAQDPDGNIFPLGFLGSPVSPVTPPSPAPGGLEFWEEDQDGPEITFSALHSPAFPVLSSRDDGSLLLGGLDSGRHPSAPLDYSVLAGGEENTLLQPLGGIIGGRLNQTEFVQAEFDPFLEVFNPASNFNVTGATSIILGGLANNVDITLEEVSTEGAFPVIENTEQVIPGGGSLIGSSVISYAKGSLSTLLSTIGSSSEDSAPFAFVAASRASSALSECSSLISTEESFNWGAFSGQIGSKQTVIGNPELSPDCSLVLASRGTITDLIGRAVTTIMEGDASAILASDDSRITPDIFSSRPVNALIAASEDSEITGQASRSSILSASFSTLRSQNSVLLGGTNNQTTSSNALSSAILGGDNNSISERRSAVIAGNNNSIEGTSSAIIGGNDHTLDASGSVSLGSHSNYPMNVDDTAYANNIMSSGVHSRGGGTTKNDYRILGAVQEPGVTRTTFLVDASRSGNILCVSEDELTIQLPPPSLAPEDLRLARGAEVRITNRSQTGEDVNIVGASLVGSEVEDFESTVEFGADYVLEAGRWVVMVCFLTKELVPGALTNQFSWLIVEEGEIGAQIAEEPLAEENFEGSEWE